MLSNVLRKPKNGETVSPPETNVDYARKAKQKKRKRLVLIAAGCLVLAAAVFFGWRYFSATRSSTDSGVTYTTATVGRQDISVTLSGSGTLQPADSYDVTSLVSGEILSDDFEEGDVVEEGAALYQIDTADAETSIKSAELSLEKAQLSYNNLLESLEDLNIKAPAAGTVTELNVEVGDSVSNGQTVATIRDSSTMSIELPFNSSDVDSFYIGESAEVTLDSTFETLSGTVSSIGGVEQVLTGNMLVKYVTIDVSNPGGITDSTEATARVGDIACNGSAAFEYKAEKTVTASASGDVVSVSVSEGTYVSKNTVLVRLDSSDMEESIKSSALSLEDAENSLENKKEALDDYTITSPIAGTIIEKSYKAGDKLNSSSNSTTLCTIYDLSYLTMEISVDELDIGMVSVGQEVSITADAVEGEEFTGTVTKVSIVGTTSNGVTAYPITVRIDDTEGLLPGMNVDAEIVVESVTDVLAVPVDAVVRGNMILVKTSDESAAETNGTATPEETGSISAGASLLPDGFTYVQVTLGVNNDDYIEITSGLEEGDTIAIATVNTDTGESTATTGLMGGGAGGSYSGGGDFSGGPPSGGGPMGG